MSAATATASSRQGSPHVIARGASGRLFYESYAHEFTDIANTLREPLFPLPDAIRWKRLLETRGRLLKQRGRHLYILIAPDAHFIYRDAVPPHIVLPARSPARQFTELFSGIDNVTIVNPEEALIAARGGVDVYKVNDTHWSAHGAFIAYRCLLDVLPPGTPMHPVTVADVAYKPHRSFGDLGALVEPEVTTHIPVAVVRDGSSRHVRHHIGDGRNAWLRCESSRGLGHAFLPRDSFATELGIFVSETFARVDWIGGTSRLHLEAIDEEKPDVVIWQIAERRLFHIEHDHHAKTAYEIYAFDRTTPFGKLAIDAYSDQMQGNLPSALQHARAAARHPDAGAPYRYLIAELLEASGDVEEGEAVIKQAIALQDNRPAYWHLLSIIARRRDDLAAALAASERAVKLFPHNARFVADHGYNLLAFGRNREAIDVMQACRDLVSDAPHLSYWLAEAYLRMGDWQSARREAVNAYLLLPQHSEIFQLAWKIEDYLDTALRQMNTNAAVA
ncbi:MAG: tetratricopeptide repeat protein [Hyphomonadaceae bacterium]|jgi:Flp pilus assembly protein TadD|nr:tetratricopeptide repeat protein [Hyphomonadaceae bacterium]